MDFRMVRPDDVLVPHRERIDMGDIDGLVNSIKEKGVLEPIILNASKQLLAGGRRLLAAKQAGLDVIPAVVLKNTSKLDDLEIELIENTVRKDFTWPERARLEKRIFELKSNADPKWSRRRQADITDAHEWSVRRRLALAEALETLPELADLATEDEAWKEYKKLEENYVVGELMKKVPAEVKNAARWAEDHYKVGDALKMMKDADEGIAHFAEVDPPYGVEIVERKSRNKTNTTGEYNEIPRDEYPGFLRMVASQAYRILKSNSFMVFWYGPTWHHEVLTMLREVGFSVPDIPAVWVKPGGGQTASPDTTLGSSYEPFFLARKGMPKLVKPGRSNVFDFKPVPPTKKVHPTEKPIPLLDEIIHTTCFPGSVIFSPFLGSGVTLLSAYKNGHTGWGYDLDKTNKENFLKRVYEDVLAGEPEDDGNDEG